MPENIWLWVGFLTFVGAMLAIDLGIFQRSSHEVSVREAAGWTIVWVVLAFVFNFGLYLFWHQIVPNSDLNNREAGLAFLAAYLIEYSLSVDNIFVFVLLFSYFAVPAIYQHRVLFWGILGALLMRGIMITVGAALIERFHWILYLFGAFLLYTGIQLARSNHGEEVNPDKNPLLRLARRVFPITEDYEGDKFFVVRQGVRMATPLLLVLLVVESTDLVFALDSIPAIFAITTEPYIAFTSNVFAILGLRSLYFLLANMMRTFSYLQLGLAIILSFVGVKMLIAGFYEIPILVSLAVIVLVLAISVIASIYWPPAQEQEHH
jgi:tellurite resistance protein TerC